VGTLFPLGSLFAGSALLVVGVGLLFSVLGLRAGLADFSTITTGAVMSAYFVGYAAGVFGCPALIRRIGHIRAFAAMASVASTMPILHALWVNPWFWGALRFITGACLVGLYIAVESWLNAVAPRETRGKVFAAYLTVTFLALATGQLLLLFGEPLGFVPFVMVSVLLSFALLPITLTPLAEPAVTQAPRFSMLFLWRASRLGVVGSCVSGMLSGAFFGLGAVFAQRVGMSASGVAVFMAATIVGGALFQWPVGHWSDRTDRRKVLFWVASGTAVAALVGYTVLWLQPWLLVPVAVLLGGLMFSVYGLSVAHANDWVDASRTLELTGGLLLVHGFGAALGPIVAGVLMDGWGPGSLLLYVALATSALALFALRVLAVSQAVPDSEKVDFIPTPASSPAVLQLDPRQEEALPKQG
jgi:MFS family permease